GGNTDTLVYIYDSYGSYDITLNTIDSNGCYGEITKTIEIYPNPQINFIASDTIGCYPLSVLFTNQSSILSGQIVDWVWDLGNIIIDNEYNVSTSYPNAFATYDITLTAISDKGCTSTLT